MSLITRCPACGTMFKVVTDQLKVSRGWVRCGRCAHVFDAPLNLQPVGAVPSDPADAAEAEKGVDGVVPQSATVAGPSTLSTPSAPSAPFAHPVPPVQPAGVPVPIVPVAKVAPRWITDSPPPAPAAEADDDAPDSAADFDPAAWRDAQKRRQQEEGGFGHSLPAPLGITRPAAIESPAATPDDGDSLIDSSIDSSLEPSADSAPPPKPEEPRSSRPAQIRTETADETYIRYDFDDSDQSDLPAAREVSFVREARRKAFWSRKGVRVGLVALTVFMTLTLALQWALQRRDDLAVLNPGLAPLLQGACAFTGCEIRPPRHIDSLMIDSSTFNKIGVDAYRLSFVLKNTGSIPVEVPSLEVTLTDPQDQALIRRVVIPAQFGVSAKMLAARSDVSGSLSMKVVADGNRLGGVAGAAAGASSASPLSAPLPVAGYRVVAFYP